MKRRRRKEEGSRKEVCNRQEGTGIQAEGGRKPSRGKRITGTGRRKRNIYLGKKEEESQKMGISGKRRKVFGHRRLQDRK